MSFLSLLVNIEKNVNLNHCRGSSLDILSESDILPGAVLVILVFRVVIVIGIDQGPVIPIMTLVSLNFKGLHIVKINLAIPFH